MSIENILAKLGLTDEEALEFVTHYNREYFDKCSFSLSLSANPESSGENMYVNISVDIDLKDAEGNYLFSGNEYCSVCVSS